jgi:hypothetical protein
MAEGDVEILAETENFAVWRSEEEGGEVSYHLDVGAVTLHFFREEWQELLDLLRQIRA